MQFALLNGFVDGICKSIAVEQTGLRPNAEEVQRRAAYLASIFSNQLISLWEYTANNNDIGTVRDHILKTNKNLELNDNLKTTLLMVIGYAIGAATVNYTPVILSNRHHAIDVRLGEMWMAQPLEMIGKHITPVGDEVLLAKTQHSLLWLRWARDDSVDKYASLLHGHALPSSFHTPIVNISPMRDLRIAADYESGGHT